MIRFYGKILGELRGIEGRMELQRWNIYWNEYVSDTYLYGSEITFHKKDDVEFLNHLMSPGTVLKQWYSKTNYQAQRIEPALPMIDGETNYQIIVNIDCIEGENWLMRLVFYDRYEMEAGAVAIRDRVTNFKCPLKTYSYRLQLINGGMTHFHFHSVVIREIEDETEEKTKTAGKVHASGKKLRRKHEKAVRRGTGSSDRGVQGAPSRGRKPG